MSDKQELVLQATQQKQLVQGLAYADRYVNRQYLIKLDLHDVIPEARPSYQFMRLYRISKFIYDADEDVNDKLISVYGALNSIHSSVVLVIRAFEDGVEFYMGTRCVQASTAGYIIESALKGNFGGSQIESLTSREIQKVLADELLAMRSNRCKSVSSVTLVPSRRDDEKERFVQGMEKLIDALNGQAYTAVLIAEPLTQETIETKKRGLEELYATISPFSETTLSYGNNASRAVANGVFSSFSDSINNSVTNSTSESQSQSFTEGTSDNYSFSSSGDGSSASFGGGSSSSQTYGTSQSWSNAVTSGETRTTSSGSNHTVTDTIGESRTVSVKHVNKSVSELMQQIDQQLKRIHECESFGLWSAAAYFVSNDIQLTTIAASTFHSLVAGDTSYLDKALINTWVGDGNPNTMGVLKSIAYGVHPLICLPRANQFDEQMVKPTVLVSGKELPLFAGLPRKSVPGLVVDHMASFGRAVFNPYGDPNAAKLSLGCVMHKGIAQKNLDVCLDLEELRAHCFVTGSTGSGKSNTIYCLLESFIQRGIHFLVIEPAKGEYKLAFGGLPGIRIFWTNPTRYDLLRLNPFSFPPGIHVLEHMDRLIEIFNACWPLYSAMPAILKSAVERAYAACGWDLVNSIRIDNGTTQFPTFADLLRELPLVINESSYSADAKGDYTGALVTRVSSMTNGIMGSIFCSGMEVEDSVLFDGDTIVDLSRVGASETKSLIMGILVMKLNEHRMSGGAGMNQRLRHMTILEEAHNLLRRNSTSQSAESSNVAGKSVEMISNSIAEMRTYGEGFIIVDQSPTAVDISAIKNTNTKIVMRLPEQSDFDAVGSSFALNEDQIREIARLRRGAAIVSQSGWLEPVMVSVHRAGSQYETPERSEEDSVRDDTVNQYIQKVLSQADNLYFNEHTIDLFLRKTALSANRKEELIQLFREVSCICQKKGELSRTDKASFVVRAIGCAALADIFPLRLSPGQTREENQKTYDRWRRKIAGALENYGDFGTVKERSVIATDLLLYMALCIRRPSYTVARNLLIQKE